MRLYVCACHGPGKLPFNYILEVNDKWKSFVFFLIFCRMYSNEVWNITFLLWNFLENCILCQVILCMSLTPGVRWVVYAPENGYNFPYPSLLRVKSLLFPLIWFVIYRSLFISWFEKGLLFISSDTWKTSNRSLQSDIDDLRKLVRSLTKSANDLHHECSKPKEFVMRSDPTVVSNVLNEDNEYSHLCGCACKYIHT